MIFAAMGRLNWTDNPFTPTPRIPRVGRNLSTRGIRGVGRAFSNHYTRACGWCLMCFLGIRKTEPVIKMRVQKLERRLGQKLVQP